MHRILRTDCLIAACVACVAYLAALPAQARIQVDAVTNATGTAISSKTFSHTVATKTNRVIVVISAVTHSNPGCTVSTVTYAGASLSEGRNSTSPAAPPFVCAATYYKLAPATGANDVVVTWGEAIDAVVVGAISLYGVKQVAPEDNNGNFGIASTTVSSSLNIATVGAMIVDAVSYGSTGALTPDGSQTERIDVSSGSNRGGMSTLVATSAVSTSVGWTGDSTNTSHAASAFVPFRGDVLMLSGTTN